MKVLDPGHRYQLDTLDGDLDVQIAFVKREGPNYPGNVGAHPGCTVQEVLRVLIDRVKHVDTQKPDFLNRAVLNNLRVALWYLEARAAARHGLAPLLHKKAIGAAETIPVCPRCGHWTCPHEERKL